MFLEQNYRYIFKESKNSKLMKKRDSSVKRTGTFDHLSFIRVGEKDDLRFRSKLIQVMAR